MTDLQTHPFVLHVEQTETRNPSGALLEVACSAVQPNPHQPRTHFDETDLATLRESLKKHGFIQPIIVRPGPDPDSYVLIAGERRLRAAIEAGFTTVPAVVRTVSEQDGWVHALIENVDRVNLNPVEEGEAYRALMEGLDLTQEALAERIGVSRTRISQAVLLPGLPDEVKRRVAAGVLTFGHARVLCGLRDPGQQVKLAARIVAEGLTVRQTEELVLLGDLPGWEEDRPKKTRKRGRAVYLDRLSRHLGEALDTRVKVKAAVGKGRGQIIIDFADEDDLNRILATMKEVPEPDKADIDP